jgi:hypothetical protein
MSDVVSRAVGAGKFIKVGDEEYQVAPLGLKQLKELQLAAVDFYKRQYLKTFADNLDLLGKSGMAILREQMEIAARWSKDDLPFKASHSVSNVPLSEAMIDKLIDLYDDVPRDEDVQRALLVSALDRETITLDEVEQLTGERPERMRIPYDAWWVTGTYDGMIGMIRASLSKNHPEITLEKIADWNPTDLTRGSRMIEELTAPAMGNT